MFTNKKVTAISLLLVLALAALLAACAAPGQATTPSPDNATVAQGGITVVGMGEAFGQPDQAKVQVGVEVFAPTVSEATSQNEATIQQVMDALAAQGIAAEDIQTSNYSLWAEQRYGDNGPEGIVGYRASNQVNVTIRDISKVGDVLAAVTEAGANSIYGISFSVADPDALEAEARAQAVADARIRAQSLAELGDVELGEIQAISEVIGQPVMPYGMGGGGMVAEEAAVASVSPGQLSYQVQVQVTFGLR
jgi:uncharacterized protein YggE